MSFLGRRRIIYEVSAIEFEGPASYSKVYLCFLGSSLIVSRKIIKSVYLYEVLRSGLTYSANSE